jgi:hypothetical protein
MARGGTCIRFSSCCVRAVGDQLASISGLRTSSMFTATGTPSRFAQFALRFLMSSPFLPITTPDEKMVMRAFLAGRSIRTRGNCGALGA